MDPKPAAKVQAREETENRHVDEPFLALMSSTPLTTTSAASPTMSVRRQPSDGLITPQESIRDMLNYKQKASFSSSTFSHSSSNDEEKKETLSPGTFQNYQPSKMTASRGPSSRNSRNPGLKPPPEQHPANLKKGTRFGDLGQHGNSNNDHTNGNSMERPALTSRILSMPVERQTSLLATYGPDLVARSSSCDEPAHVGSPSLLTQKQTATAIQEEEEEEEDNQDSKLTTDIKGARFADLLRGGNRKRGRPKSPPLAAGLKAPPPTPTELQELDGDSSPSTTLKLAPPTSRIVSMPVERQTSLLPTYGPNLVARSSACDETPPTTISDEQEPEKTRGFASSSSSDSSAASTHQQVQNTQATNQNTNIKGARFNELLLRGPRRKGTPEASVESGQAGAKAAPSATADTKPATPPTIAAQTKAAAIAGRNRLNNMWLRKKGATPPLSSQPPAQVITADVRRAASLLPETREPGASTTAPIPQGSAALKDAFTTIEAKKGTKFTDLNNTNPTIAMADNDQNQESPALPKHQEANAKGRRFLEYNITGPTTTTATVGTTITRPDPPPATTVTENGNLVAATTRRPPPPGAMQAAESRGNHRFREAATMARPAPLPSPPQCDPIQESKGNRFHDIAASLQPSSISTTSTPTHSTRGGVSRPAAIHNTHVMPDIDEEDDAGLALDQAPVGAFRVQEELGVVEHARDRVSVYARESDLYLLRLSESIKSKKDESSDASFKTRASSESNPTNRAPVPPPTGFISNPPASPFGGRGQRSSRSGGLAEASPVQAEAIVYAEATKDTSRRSRVCATYACLIAVIAILVGVLLPVISNKREADRIAKSKINPRCLLSFAEQDAISHCACRGTASNILELFQEDELELYDRLYEYFAVGVSAKTFEMDSCELENQALLYMSNFHRHGLDKNDPRLKEIPFLGEVYAVILLYLRMEGDQWLSRQGWLDDGLNVCDWFGITCGLLLRISSIALSSNNLAGQVPTEISSVSSLTLLDLSRNEGITGEIPTGIYKTPRLHTLDLSDTNVTGQLQPEISNLERLDFILLSHTGLTGTLPSEIGLLTSLISLKIERNKITGTIPTEIGRLSRLRDLILDRNQLTGTLPTEFAALTDIEVLDISRNHLEGTIPDYFGKDTRLEIVDIIDSGLAGTIPETYCLFEELVVDRVIVGNCEGENAMIPNCTCCSREDFRISLCVEDFPAEALGKA